MKSMPTILRPLVASILLCTLCGSCSETPEEPVAVLELATPGQQTVQIAPTAATVEVPFRCNNVWSATVEPHDGPSWLTVTPAGGQGSAGQMQQLTLRAEANSVEQPREGVVSLVSGDRKIRIRLTQGGAVVEDVCALVEPTQARIDVPFEGARIEVRFLCNKSWSAALDEPLEKPWLHLSPAQGEGSRTDQQAIALIADPSEVEEPRTAAFTVRSGELRFTVQVTQAAKVVYCELLDPEQARMTVPAEGGNYPVRFRCNNAWFATADARYMDWFAVSPASGKPGEECTVTLKVKPNTAAQERTAEALLVASGDLVVTLSVTQAAAEPQPIAFPDPVLKAYLVNEYDTNADGEIDTAEAARVTMVKISPLFSAGDDKKVRSTEGLEQLTALESLTLSNCLITQIDLRPFGKLAEAIFKVTRPLATVTVAGNTSIRTLDVSSTALTALDLTGCTALENLLCSSMSLKGFDFLTGGESLRKIESNLNAFTGLDMHRFPALEELDIIYNKAPITSTDFRSNGALKVLAIQNSEMPGTIDLSACSALETVRLTSLGLTGFMAPRNGEHLTNVSIESNHLAALDFSGCPNLTYLRCFANPLETLDLSGFTKLEDLQAHNCGMRELKLDGSTAIQRLTLDKNQFTDATFLYAFPGLTSISMANNQLAAFDPSHFTELHTLELSHNLLTGSIDVSMLPAVNVHVNVQYNTDLEKLIISGQQAFNRTMELAQCIIRWNGNTVLEVKPD